MDERGLSEFAVRIGIESGLAVLGAKGTGGNIAYAATGDALNTAARLQSQAEPGTVLVGDATRRMVAPLFDWSDTVSLHLKGKADPRSGLHSASASEWHGREGWRDRRFR